MSKLTAVFLVMFLLHSFSGTLCLFIWSDWHRFAMFSLSTFTFGILLLWSVLKP